MHIIDHWGLGGAQRVVSSLTQQNGGHCHKVVSLYAHHAHDWPLPEGNQVRFLAKSYAETLRIPLRLRAEIEKEKPAALHVHLNGSRFMTALSLVGCAHKPPVIWHEHSDVEPFHIYGRAVGSLLTFFQRRMTKRLAGVVANSAHTGRYCRDYLRVAEEKLRVIYCPVDCEDIRVKADQPLTNLPPGADPARPIVGFVGRLAKQKGLKDLLCVAQRLIEARPDCQVWIVGDGPKREQLQNRALQNGLGDRMIFWGRREDVFPIMNAMSLLLMPSLYEPYGLAAIEGLTLGKPVVGYQVGGLSEVLRRHELGEPVPPEDKDALFQRALRVLEETSATTRPRLTAFDSKHVFRQWDNYYRRITGRKIKKAEKRAPFKEGRGAAVAH